MHPALYPLLVDVRAKEEILGFGKDIRQEIKSFLLKLASGPYSPVIMENSEQHSEDFFAHKLPCGCYVFWEILYDPFLATIGRLKGLVIRVVGVRYNYH